MESMQDDGVEETDIDHNASREEHEKQEEVAEEPAEKVSYLRLFIDQWPAAVTYCSAYFSMGMGSAFLGPTIYDLGCLVEKDEKTMSWLFMAQMFAALVGTTVAGLLTVRYLRTTHKRLVPQTMLFIATVMLPATMSIIPLAKLMWVLACILAVMGFNMGVIDNVVNYLMIDTFNEHANPFFQVLYFSYGLGALVSPLIAEPFLLNEDCSTLIDNLTQIESVPHNQTTSPHPPFKEILQHAKSVSNVSDAFWIMSGILAFVPCFMLALLLYEHWTRRKKSGVSEDGASSLSLKNLLVTDSIHTARLEMDGGASGRCCVTPTATMVALVVIASIIGLIYDGYQNSVGGYIFTYAIRLDTLLDKTKAAYLNSLFWGTTAVGRLMTLLLSFLLTPAFLLLLNLIGCTAALLWIYLGGSKVYVLYVGFTLLGLSMSSTVPTMLALVRRFTHVNATAMTVFIISCNVGEMAFPTIVGTLISDYGGDVLILFGLAVSALGFVFYTALMIVGSSSPTYHDQGHFCCLKKLKKGEEMEFGKSSQRKYTDLESEQNESS